MITGDQLRAARALLKWSAEEAAKQSKVTRKTIERLEHANGIPSARTITMESIQRAFEAAGIEFLGTPESGPGVRLWRKPED